MRIVTMVAAALLGVRFADPGVVPPTAFQQTAQGGIVVEVRLNGFGPFRFLVDTGSSHSVVSESAARVSGARAAGRTIVASPAGQEIRALVRLDRLELGPEPALGVLASVVPSLPSPLDGIIGQDVLAARRYTIDFTTRRIEWHGEAPELVDSTSAFRLEFDEGRPVVLLPQPGTLLRLVPDSGAQGLILFGAVSRALYQERIRLQSRSLITLTGRRAARQVSLRELHVGRLTLRDVDAVIVEDANVTGCDGLLPLQLFARVTFDGPGKVVVVSGVRRHQG